MLKCIYIKKLLFLSVLSIELLLLQLLLSITFLFSVFKRLNDLDPVALSEETNVSQFYRYFSLVV